MSLTNKIYIFSDLDDTLFQTKRKCAESVTLTRAAIDRDGQSLSFFTQEQQTLLALLRPGTLIPVTGRNTPALERVQLEFTSYRITSHGAMVLGKDGLPLREWLTLHEFQYTQWLCHMETALVWLEDQPDVRCRVVEDQGFPMYVSIKGGEQALQDLAGSIHKVWGMVGAQVHRNGQNMALLPPFACKEKAVRFVMTRLQREGIEPLFIGMGDSISDLPFLGLCHYAIMPCRSQLHGEAWAALSAYFSQSAES